MQEASRSSRWQRSLTTALPVIYPALLLGLNVYVCREGFYRESTGHFNSVHGIWMALARLGQYTSWKPAWFPWWGAGVPLEFAYAPLVPALTAFVSRAAHIPIALAFNQITATAYCLTPLTLYFAAWRLSGSAASSFAAALACSLLSPITLLTPDGPFRWSTLLNARRFYVVFDWDDLPHLIAIVLLPLLIWSLIRAFERRRLLYYVSAAILITVMMLASMFGFVLAALVVITIPLTAPIAAPALRSRAFLSSVFVAACAYIVVSPWIPPSLLWTIHSNSVRDGESANTGATLIALFVIAIAAAGTNYALTRLTATGPTSRSLMLIAVILILIPGLDAYTGLHFLPQPGRYKDEADLALIGIIVFSLRPLVRRWPFALRSVLVVLLLAVATRQTIAYRRYARAMLGPVDVSRSIEFEAARWVESHLPGQRVLLTGSIANWANLFTDDMQLASAPYTTIPNFNQVIATFIIDTGLNAGPRDTTVSILWMKAFGVAAVSVPGPQSPEYWKPFANPRKFDGVLPELWRDRDTAIYQVTKEPDSLAHVVRPEDLVQRPPAHGLDTAEIERYVSAVGRNGAPPARFAWKTTDRAVIDAKLSTGDFVSAQINWFPGWRAFVNGRRANVRRDGLGLIAIEPGCTGDCHIMLEYAGSPELWACRYASLAFLTILLIGAAAALLRRADF